MTTFTVPSPDSITEDEFTHLIVSLAQLAGWEVDDRGRDQGQGLHRPRLILAREGTVLFVVVRSNKNQQVPTGTKAWLDALPPGAGRVWRPKDWADIEGELVG